MKPLPLISNYIRLYLYAAPWIDVLNEVFLHAFPIGQVLRMGFVTLNAILIAYYAPRRNARLNVHVLFACCYLLFHVLFVALIDSFVTLSMNAAYAAKLALFLSGFVLLVNAIDAGSVCAADFERFWKYSFFCLPGLILCSHFSGFLRHGAAGVFVSGNAIGIILVTQTALLLHFAEQDKNFLFLLPLNVVSAFLLGTKSPIAFILLLLFMRFFLLPRRRISALVAGPLIAIGIFVVLQVFSEQWEYMLAVQRYRFRLGYRNGAWFQYLLTGRNVLLSGAWEAFFQNGFFTLLRTLIFGHGLYHIGQAVSDFMGWDSIHGIEMDFFEVMFSFGILIAIYLYSFFFKALKWKVSGKALYVNTAIILTVIHSVLGGHTITEGISSTYCAILLAYKYALKAESSDALSLITRRKRFYAFPYRFRRSRP